MKEETKKDFHFLPYMYNYRKTTDAISGAADADEVDIIVKHFIESVSVLYTRKHIVSQLYLYIESESGQKSNAINNKMLRAMELIRNYIQGGYETS